MVEDARRSPDDSPSLEPIVVSLETWEMTVARVQVLARAVEAGSLSAAEVVERLNAIAGGMLAWK